MKQFLFLILLTLLVAPAFAQSTNQDFPSPVLNNEIGGTIVARDIGDARLTQHFYTFYANNGDLYLNIETANLEGDIDLFEAKTLRPLSKISIYAGSSPTSTSRIVYFRQRLQVVLRVEGRTSNDEPARYKIAFSGSFAAGTDLPQPPETVESQISNTTNSNAVARVNSAGTIIEVLPTKKQAEAEEKPVENIEEPVATKPAKIAASRRNPPASRTSTPTGRRNQPTQKDSNSTYGATETEAEAKPTPVTKPPVRPRPTPRTRTNTTASRSSQPNRTTAVAEPKIDPLENVRLVVLLKDGYKIERPMSEVLRVNVDKGQLVVITKDGKIERFTLLDVLKMTIEQ